ncbi:hypothetical protein BOTBODRAFT_186882 [Botryobasidium botryosum FD-172 SS1]|uniref:Uncharacterized protein n=1 Tax=Botryobasidium botryosum (strain FD-172 SS1) TaxID=930990 RepID=A0A067MJY4_BOTB1|nr:hypothetical protein BOTBODRAFT_186882 [Botryobasidium botryosum FD-172 SS1]
MSQTRQPRPSDAKGSLDELWKLTYVSLVADDHFKAGDNKLQVLGNQLLSDLMRHSVHSQTKLELFPDLQPLKPECDLAAQSYKAFLRLSAIHVLCHQAKGFAGLDHEIKDAIVDKSDAYFRMAALPLPPSSFTGPDGHVHQPSDPVVEYGWDRQQHAHELKSLQHSFLQTTLFCYDHISTVAVPQLASYFHTPDYWYDALSDYLKSEQCLQRWRMELASPGAQPKYRLGDLLRTLTFLQRRCHDQHASVDIPQVTLAPLAKEAGLTLAAGGFEDKDLEADLANFVNVVGGWKEWKFPDPLIDPNTRFEPLLKIVMPQEKIDMSFHSWYDYVPIVIVTKAAVKVTTEVVIPAAVEGYTHGLVKVVDDNDVKSFTPAQRIVRFLERQARPLGLFNLDGAWLHSRMISIAPSSGAED